MCGWIAVRTARSGWRETAGGWAAAGSLALPSAFWARAEASFVKQTVRRGGGASSSLALRSCRRSFRFALGCPSCARAVGKHVMGVERGTGLSKL
jgi:hypothetical protein